MNNNIDKIRLQEAFLLMDEDNSGLITIDDFHFLLRALKFTPTENDLKRIDAEIGLDRKIDYLWFIDLISKVSCTKYSYEQIQNAFITFDENRYGRQTRIVFHSIRSIFVGLINKEKFQIAMMTLGEPLSEEEMKEMLKDLPVDEDGYCVSMDEYFVISFSCLLVVLLNTKIFVRNFKEKMIHL